MSWNIGDNRNLILKLETKLGLYHVELRSKPNNSPEKKYAKSGGNSTNARY